MTDDASGWHVRRWAPRANRMEVVADDCVYELAASGQPGWFEATVPLPHGSDYRIAIDGTAVTDPLGRWLPQGVNGPSRVWNPALTKWGDQTWRGHSIRDAGCIYELHVGTFTPEGTLDSAISKLDHLSQLGITHVELMPLSAFDGDWGWGYDGVALNAVHNAYGGPDALCRFVDACHARKLAVILDVVHNHFGPSGNYWAMFAPMTTDRYQTPWGEAINLDSEGSDNVRRILIDSSLAWIRNFHLDGLRLDAVHELIDNRAITFLEELSQAVDEEAITLGRTVETIAESDRNDSATVTSRELGGLGLSAQWDDDIHHALHWLFTGETAGYYADFGSVEAARYALEHGFLHDGRWSSFRQQTHGRPIDFTVTDPWRLVVAIQTHDQVGNRSQGERLSQLADIDAQAAATATLMTLPYTPMLFMGEEWGARTPWQFFTSFPDAQLGEAVTRGRTAEFQSHDWTTDVPDPQDPATFQRSKLDWSQPLLQDHARLLQWYHDLIKLRREDPALGSCSASDDAHAPGGLSVEITKDPEGGLGHLILRRGPWATVVNTSAHAQVVALASPGWTVALEWSGCSAQPGVVSNTESEFTLAPGATIVAKLKHEYNLAIK